jgi:hypothetical protein
MGLVDTRYADDLSFSASGEAARDNVGRLLGRVRWILRDEGFTPHPDKERVMRKGRRQEVTGLVVNGEQPGVSRETRRRLRAALHRATQASPGKPAHWQGQAAQPSQLLGLAQFVHQVAPAQGGALLAQARQLQRSPVERVNDALREAGRQDRAAARARPASAQFRQRAASGQAPVLASGEPWWQPAQPAAPVLEQTDQQRREQRQQARQAARPQPAAATEPAPQAAAAPVTAPPATEKTPLPGLLAYWVQIVICFVLGTVFQARLITLIGIVLVVILRYRRIRRWDVFAGAMVVAVLLGLGLRLS